MNINIKEMPASGLDGDISKIVEKRRIAGELKMRGLSGMEDIECQPEYLGVLLIGFSPVMREGLLSILARDNGIKVVGHVSDGQEALLYIKRVSKHMQSVNVILTGTQNGVVDGVQVTRLIKDEFPEITVLVLTENLNDSYVIDTIHAGASGYIFLQDISTESLLQNIHRAVEGNTQISTELLRSAIEHLLQNGRKTLTERMVELAHLTEREVDVLRLMGNGDSNKIIAETLGITIDTAKKHVGNIIDKLQARNRTHASIIAARVGLVGNPVKDLPAILETINLVK